jgi:hypothetical protein
VNRPRIALISATPAAIGPATSALAAEFPAADVWNLLDDKLLADADEQGGLGDDLAARMRRLIDHAVAGGADGVLLTCSMYGPVARERDLGLPVLAPDEAAFDELVGYRSILVVASLESALRDALARLSAFLAESGASATVRGVVSTEAFEATGDTDRLATVLGATAREHAASVDAVFLAQYSLAPATEAVAESSGLPVVAGPVSAAVRLRGALGDPSSLDR